MKVLQVIDTLKVGGAERVFVDMVNVLSVSGVSVEVLLINSGGDLEGFLDKSVVVHNLQRINKYSLKKAFALYALCKKFDVVHVHMRHCYSYVRATQLLFSGNYKVILHDHYGDIDIDKTVPLKLKLLFKPSFYIGVSHVLTDWASRSLKAERVFLLRNTIIPQPGVGYIGGNGLKALMVANIRPTKNIEFAIELCTRLNICLDIYGNVSDQHYCANLKARISGNSNIRIIEGVTAFGNVYCNYGLALHTARSETGPLVLLEYMAYGIPFISYKTGEVARSVGSQLPLNFVDSFDIQTWERRIQAVLQEENLSAKLKAVFNENFSMDNYVKQCLQIYQDVGC